MRRYVKFVLPFFLSGALGAAGNPAPGLNRFATAAYQELARGDGNLIFSPFSVSNALSMLLEGARGQTARQMAAVLGQSYPDTAYSAALASLVAELTKAANTGGNELLAANGLWVQNNFRTQAEFRRAIEAIYHAPLVPLDFWHNTESARDAINSWTSRQTKGRIGELYPPGSLDADTRLVLTSAIYFHGKWESPFHPDDTAPAPFHLASGAAVETRFMRQTARFGYTETPAVQVLEMKYAGTPLAFDIVLPKQTGGLGDVENSLTPDRIAAWTSTLKSRKVEIMIPRFRTEAQFSLRDALSRIGMPDAFRADADFSGIDDRRDLYLSDVLHKAYVDVTEEGTEAAAATGGTVQFIAMVQEPRTVFRADHPFTFLIRDTRGGIILFGGRLMKPL